MVVSDQVIFVRTREQTIIFFFFVAQCYDMRSLSKRKCRPIVSITVSDTFAKADGDAKET